MQTRVSIVIPVYNAEQYIEACVESVRRQTYSDIEVILVDDGSKDGSLGVCLSICERDDRVRVVSQENAGPSAARNRGIEETSGQYIVFVDADDSIEATCIEEAVRAIEGVDIAYWGCTQKYPDGTERRCIPQAAEAHTRAEVEAAVYRLKRNEEGYPYFGFTWNKIFQRDIIEEHKIRFEEGLSAYEDAVFTTSYMQHVGSLVVLSRALYNYRITEGGLTMMRRSVETFCRLHRLMSSAVGQYRDSRLVALVRGEAVCMLLSAARVASKFGRAVELLDEARAYVGTEAVETGRRDGLLLRLPRVVAIVALIADRAYCTLAGMKR